jgi:hypothetical protein
MSYKTYEMFDDIKEVTRNNKLICLLYLFNCLPPVTSDVNKYNLRNNQNYVPPRCRLRTSASSFIPSTVRTFQKIMYSIFKRSTAITFILFSICILDRSAWSELHWCLSLVCNILSFREPSL